jgi:hypothetical protein
MNPTGTRRRRGSQESEAERGSTAAESALALGLVLVVLFGVFQYLLDVYGREAAQAAAGQALAEAVTQNGTTAQARDDATAILAQLTGFISEPSVSVQRSSTEAHVTVTGRADAVFGIPQHITVSAAGPIDRFVS